MSGAVWGPIGCTCILVYYCILLWWLYSNYESISLSSSKSYTRAEIGYVTEVNLVRK